MTNTIRLNISCFLLLFTVLLIKDILDLAWHLATRMKFGTCEQNWDLYGTISGLWPQLGPSPKFETSFKTLFLLSGFFIFRDQIFRNRDRDFFPRPNFFETETETFFRDQIFSKPKPRLFFRNQIFRNRNRNPQRFGKSFETEKFRNRNVNLCRSPLVALEHDQVPGRFRAPKYLWQGLLLLWLFQDSEGYVALSLRQLVSQDRCYELPEDPF